MLITIYECNHFPETEFQHQNESPTKLKPLLDELYKSVMQVGKNMFSDLHKYCFLQHMCPSGGQLPLSLG